MLKITINSNAYLCPTNGNEATLEFYERVHIRLPLATTPAEQCAALIGCKAEEVEAEKGGLKHNQLLGYMENVSQWLGKWAKEMEHAKAKPLRIGNVEYPLPKDWMHHQFRAHIQLTQWMEKSTGDTLVSDVISLYLAPSVFGNDWSEEDRLHLRKTLLMCRAIDVAPLFFYALSRPRYSRGRGMRALSFRLLRWILQKRISSAY